MEMSKYDRATHYLKSIEHLDKILVFLHDMQKQDRPILIQETGFVCHPETVVCEKTDTDVLIQAFEREKKELEEAFKAL